MISAGLDTKRNEVLLRERDRRGGGGDKTVDRKFTFDKVFDVDTEQKTLFDVAVAPVVDQAIAGYSCTVFAYGQTGTGKTFTMEGAKREDGTLVIDSAATGVIPRAVSRIFDKLSAKTGEFHVKISYLEIYNERLEDLLAPERAVRCMPRWRHCD